MPKFQVISPHTNNLLYDYEYTSKQEALSCLDTLSVKGIHAQKKLSPFNRFEILIKLKDLIQRDMDKLAQQIHLETGKLKEEAVAEVKRCLITLQVSAEQAKRINGQASDFYQHTEKLEERFSYTKRFPLGVIFCITPFNFPLNLAMHKIAPAFAAGNAILFKPHETNYKFAKHLVELCLEAGFPSESLKMISPEIQTLNEIIKDDRISCISFTGGTKTADKISQNCGRKKLLFELGGNGALIAMKDADKSLVADQIISGRLAVSGQTCTSAKRIFIHTDIYNDVKDKLLNKIKHKTIGPLNSEQSAKNVQDLVSDAIHLGATLLCGHNRKQAWYAPTIIENIPRDHKIIKEETFGPVISLIKFDDNDDIAQLVNDQPYGLQAGIFTKDVELVKKLFLDIEVGSIGINMHPGFRQEQLPFGGVKSSGFGREGISQAINEMSYIKQLIF